MHVSPAFRSRLMTRLRSERHRPMPIRARRLPSARAMLAMAAGLVTVAVLAREVAGTRGDSVTTRTLAESHVPAPPPLPAPVAVDPTTAPTLVAAASAGVPVWPVLMIAQDAPINFARVQFRENGAGY